MTDRGQHAAPPLVGRGFYWQDLRVGQRFRTFRRTVTETDLVNFISVTGMLESMFIDATHGEKAIPGRPVPAALVYTLIEGLLIQTTIQGTALALLEVTQRVLAPVRVGDTIGATVELTDLRPTSRSGRAVTTWLVDVQNQHGEHVMSYSVKRLIAGRPVT